MTRAAPETTSSKEADGHASGVVFFVLGPFAVREEALCLVTFAARFPV